MIDLDSERVAELRRGRLPFAEPTLATELKSHLNGQVRFHDLYPTALPEVDFAFICVDTHSDSDGRLDNSQVYAAATSLAQGCGPDCAIVLRSTTNPGTTRALAEFLEGLNLPRTLIVNPEFLRGGSSLADFDGPDRRVIGSDDEAAASKLEELYAFSDAPTIVTTEAWCTNEDFDRTRPISFPRVPYSQQHRDESWKSDYLDSLGGRSYQQNLRDLPRAEGLHFEIARYGGWTAEQMANFRQQRPEVPMLKFEALMSDFDGRFEWLFSALGLAPALMARAMTIARSEDLGRRSPPRLRANPHTTGGASSRWEEALDSSHQAAIEERFGESITRLEYR